MELKRITMDEFLSLPRPEDARGKYESTVLKFYQSDADVAEVLYDTKLASNAEHSLMMRIRQLGLKERVYTARRGDRVFLVRKTKDGDV